MYFVRYVFRVVFRVFVRSFVMSSVSFRYVCIYLFSSGFLYLGR